MVTQREFLQVREEVALQIEHHPLPNIYL